MNSDKDKLYREAAQIVDLLNTLSLFSRKTLIEWLPELISGLGVTRERSLVMFELNLQPDISLKDLSEVMMVTPASMSVMINALVEQGMVTRVPDPLDRRKVVLRLSEQGQRDLEAFEQGLLIRYGSFLEGLPETDRKELSESAGMMLSTVKRILGNGNTPGGRR